MSKSTDPNKKPQGELAIRTIARPADTNINGDIFGGWIVSQMDLAGMNLACKHTKHPVVTVAIDAMTFLSPVHLGDFICCYTDLIKTGRTSITMKIETWAINPREEVRHQVTEGVFTYVAIDDKGHPTPL